MRLGEQEFWNLSAAEYNALIEKYDEHEERADRRAALICCAIINLFSKKKFKPEDFMSKKTKATKPLDDDELVEQLRTLNAAFGGEERAV